MVGSDGITITRNKETKRMTGRPVVKELLESIKKQSSGRIRNISREGISLYSVFTRTERTGWNVAIGVPDVEIETPARRAVYFSAMALLLVFGIAALTVLFLARRLTNGFNEAVEAAKALGKGQIPQPKASKVVEAEILQSALHDAGVSLEQENRSRNILKQERERLLASAEEARQLAEDQNKAKDEFLAMLAHELRNPLAPISAAADILKIAGPNAQLVQQSSDIITRQVGHMTHLIDDLLDVSRVTRGLVELEKEKLDIKSVVSHAIEQARPIVEARGHELNLRMDAAQACVKGDETRLVQVITNLLNNAAKYTPQGGRITLTVEVHDAHVAIAVNDNGIGIEPTLLPHVFELFRQAERTPDRSQGGLGLGLALVKSIMALHDGRAEAYSEGLGKGSTFTLTLPLLNDNPGKADASTNHGVPAGTDKLFNMMVVDDNVDAATSLTTLLKAAGHKVSVHANGQEALSAALQQPAQIYILDIGMPDITGYDLVRQLKAQPANAQAIFIALTGYGQAHDKVLSKAAGFDHHFVKPMDMAKLSHILSKAGSSTKCD